MINERMVVVEHKLEDLKSDVKYNKDLLLLVQKELEELKKKSAGQVSFISGVSAAISFIFLLFTSVGEKIFLFIRG